MDSKLLKKKNKRIVTREEMLNTKNRVLCNSESILNESIEKLSIEQLGRFMDKYDINQMSDLMHSFNQMKYIVVLIYKKDNGEWSYQRPELNWNLEYKKLKKNEYGSLYFLTGATVRTFFDDVFKGCGYKIEARQF